MQLLTTSLKALRWLLPACAASIALAQHITGPSSSQAPYILRAQPGVVTASILTAGDAVNFKPDGVTPYRMTGIPDGLGAFNNGDGTFTLLVNQELGGGAGVVRDHGFKGSYVSKWTIASSNLLVLHGEDLIKQGFYWNTNTLAYEPVTNSFNRFCSADLPALSAFYDAASGLGYSGRIFMNGEESGSEGRCFAHLMNGNSYELPWLGKFSHENSVANPATGVKTVVVGTDDNGSGQVYVYVGNKSSSTDPIEAAGLKGGSLFAIQVSGLVKETDATTLVGGASFTAVNFGDVSAWTGARLETESTNALVTAFNRPEDACWDPSNPKDLYFVTTAGFTGRSRLWRLRFIDPSNPALGGTATILLDGTEGPKMMDNITISKRGSIFIQEDVGNQAHLGKIWRYGIKSGKLEVVAQHDPNFFDPASPNFLTQDEESSGILPADDILGEGWYLLDVQAHFGADAELVEGGQLNALHFPPGREK